MLYSISTITGVAGVVTGRIQEYVIVEMLHKQELLVQKYSKEYVYVQCCLFPPFI